MAAVRDKYHRHSDLQRQVEDVGGLLQRRRAVADDDARKIRVFGTNARTETPAPSKS